MSRKWRALSRESATFAARDLGRARQRGEVANDQAPAHRLMQTLGQDDAIAPHHRRRGSASAFEREQAVEIFHVQVDELRASESGTIGIFVMLR